MALFPLPHDAACLVDERHRSRESIRDGKVGGKVGPGYWSQGRPPRRHSLGGRPGGACRQRAATCQIRSALRATAGSPKLMSWSGSFATATRSPTSDRVGNAASSAPATRAMPSATAGGGRARPGRIPRRLSGYPFDRRGSGRPFVFEAHQNYRKAVDRPRGSPARPRAQWLRASRRADKRLVATIEAVLPVVTPQLVANDGTRALRQAIAEGPNPARRHCLWFRRNGPD